MTDHSDSDLLVDDTCDEELFGYPTGGLNAPSDPPGRHHFDDRRFAAAWPEVAAIVRLALWRHHLGAEDVDDIISETALRVITHRVPFEDAPDLANWASRVADRLAIAEKGNSARTASVAVLPDRPSRDDTEHRIEQRHAVAALLAGIGDLAASQQATIIAATTSARPLGGRERVAVHRVRNLLTIRTGVSRRGFVAGIAALLYRWRQRTTFLKLAVTAIAVLPVAGIAILDHLDRNHHETQVAATIPGRHADTGELALVLTEGSAASASGFKPTQPDADGTPRPIITVPTPGGQAAPPTAPGPVPYLAIPVPSPTGGAAGRVAYEPECVGRS